MADERLLIVNADDFGQSRGVNSGIVQAHLEGIVTSASLMVHGSAVLEAIELCTRCSNLDLGLHFDLGEWRSNGGVWEPVYEVVSIEDPERVRAEVLHQLDRFRSLLVRTPTHLDSHQHVHLKESLRPLFVTLAEEAGIPLRGCQPEVNYCS